MTPEIYKLKYEIKCLKDKCFYTSQENHELKQRVKKYEEKFDEMLSDAVDKAVALVTEKYKKIITDLECEIAKLKSQNNTNSSNSSLPPSKNKLNTKITNLREPSNKPKGGQKGHKRTVLEPFKEEEITELVDHTLHECTKCSGKLTYLNTLTSDIIDFDIEIKKTRNNIYKYKCDDCNSIVKANDFLPTGVTYGSSLNATAISLLNDSNVPYNKVVKHISGITDNQINMSEGYVVKLQKKVAKTLIPFEKELKETIKKQEILNTDDTTITIGQKQGYLRFYGNEKLALIIAHATKAKEGFEEDGILANLTSDVTLVSDHILYFYNEMFKCKNAECNSHILRYLKAVNENVHIHTWNIKLAELLRRVNKERDNVTHFSDDYIKEIYQTYDEIIKVGYQELESLPDYHHYYEKESLLLKRLDKFRDQHLLFIKDWNVPFTNNTAEKSFRISKTKMKVSGLFQNIEAAKHYGRILTYMETCYRNGINKHQAIKRLLDGNPFTVDELINKS